MNSVENQPAEESHLEVSWCLLCRLTFGQKEREKEVEEIIAQLEKDYNIEPGIFFIIFIKLIIVFAKIMMTGFYRQVIEKAEFAPDIVPWDRTESGEQYFRGVVQGTKEGLIKSFNEFGQLPTDPLLLWDNGEKMVIMGGNHRATVWKSL